MGMISAEEKSRLKDMGILLNRDGQYFSVRVITENGVIDHLKMKRIAEAAEKFGDGNMAFTSRMTVEITGVEMDNVSSIVEYLKGADLVTGGTGCRVRPIVSCKGTVCVYGLIDTQGLAKEIHQRFYVGYYDVKLPHKFKIAVGGCPNNCVKPDLNDIGIVGQMNPKYDLDKCRACGKCIIESTCPMKAVSKDEESLKLDSTLCNKCGFCIRKCPFGVVTDGEQGYKVYIGGRWGKFSRQGSSIDRMFSKEEVMDFIDKALLFYKKNGLTKERFGAMIDRIGFDTVYEALMKDDILAEKEEILRGESSR